MGKIKAFACGAVIGSVATLLWQSDFAKDMRWMLSEKLEAAAESAYSGQSQMSEEELKEKIDEARQRIAARMEENAKAETASAE